MNDKMSPRNWTGTTVNIITGLVGVVLILIAIIIHKQTLPSTILLSIGTSVFATAIVTYLSSKYLVRRSMVSDLIDKWGVQRIYRTRAEMNQVSNELLKNADHLDIIALGLKGFRESQGDILKGRIQAGMKLRILTLSAESDFLEMIDKREGLIHGATKKTIIQLKEWIDNMKQYQKYDDQVQIKFYNGIPLDFYFGLKGAVFIGPYWNKSSQQTLTYEYTDVALGAQLYKNYFEEQWNEA